MFSPLIGTASAAGLEFFLNQLLARDPVAALRLLSVQGKLIKVSCASPQLTLYVEILEVSSRMTQGGAEPLPEVKCYANCSSPVDVEVRGGASDFVALLLAEDQEAELAKRDMFVSGDLNLLLQLSELAKHFEIDWEAELSRFTGGNVAHQMGNLLKNVGVYAQDMADQFRSNVQEYVHEEARVSPSTQELQAFYDDIYDLQLRVDRLKARIDRLQDNTSI